MAIDHRRERRLRLRAPGLPRRDHLALGEPDTVPDRIEVTSRFLERAGDPWFPVTGEIHFSRISRSRWPEVLGPARAGGLDSVATYVFWQAHEPTPGVFRWDGDLDLRAFIELAQDCGLDVIVRMGPWAHGEARHGGFPDWLMELGLDTRTNDPAYLALATRFYAEIVTQLRGLTHAEGGPVGGGSDDPGELRWSVRSDGHRGYLFLTTYQPPKRPIAAQPGVSVTLDFEDATITVPSAPVDLPEGVSVAWPLRYPLTDGLVLRSATAGLLSRVSDELGDVVVMSATPASTSSWSSRARSRSGARWPRSSWGAPPSCGSPARPARHASSSCPGSASSSSTTATPISCTASASAGPTGSSCPTRPSTSWATT